MLAPELEAFRTEFERLAVEADSLAEELTDAQFNWHPERGGWSVAQCIEHLNVTARAYLPRLDEGIADAIQQGRYGRGPFRYHWFARMFVKNIDAPARWRFRAAKVFLPPPSRERHETIAAFKAYQVQYVDRLRQANGLDLARAKVTSPAARWMRLPLGAGFAAMAAHERRHLWQARRVLASAGFPRAQEPATWSRGSEGSPGSGGAPGYR